MEIRIHVQVIFILDESGYLVNAEGLYVKGNDNADIQVYDPTGTDQIASTNKYSGSCRGV